MKHIIRVFIYNVFGLWLTSQILPAITIRGNWQVILISGIILSLLMLFIKPLLKILFIPINILTFGLLSWFINVIVIYILTLLVPQVIISAWKFPGITYMGFAVPAYEFNFLLSLILVSLAITFITNLLHNISEN